MTTHNRAAYAAVAHAVKNHGTKSGNKMYTHAKRHANKIYNGAGNNNNMLNGAARYLKNHPNSKKAMKMLNGALNKN